MDYLRPNTWADALSAKAEQPHATPIAGGTDLMVGLNFGQQPPAVLLDLTSIAELADWHEAVDRKPGSYVNMPVCAYSLRMSMTSGPMLPAYTGRSTLGLPLENDRVAL